jgi:hypothetical protein
MPTCNLAKTMHHDGWCNLGKTIIDLYDTTIDDLVWTCVQQSKYKDYFIGKSLKHGQNNNELHLQTTS